jgi:8-oxo-dGTP pyrophosphatase MutT (NUDIX family)
LTVEPEPDPPPRRTEPPVGSAAGPREPVAAAARDAATVVLLRPAGAGLEVYLLRRHSAMAFAAGMYAFPGGRVDSADFAASTRWSGPPPGKWAASFHCARELARALVFAAVRETFEESGVLLAGHTPGDVVGDTTAEDWETDRKALINRTLSFSQFLQRRALVLRADLLRPWAHWITPESEPRRYDTRFFVAALPEGQLTRDVSGEADRVAWVRPSEAVAAVDRGEMAMLPPTYVTLRDLAEFRTVDDALAAAERRRIEVILPKLRVLDGETVLTLSDGTSP